MNKIKKKRLEQAKDLAESIKIYLDVNNIKWAYPRHLIRKFGVPIGKLRQALHLLNLEGTLHQGEHRSWLRGNVLRGARRSWYRPPQKNR